MGTYTTNYQLYTPTVGETGWGTLVNGNFTTIDSTMKSLSNRITAVENEVNGALSCTSVTTSGKITGNGGIAGTTGTFSGAVTGKTFNGVVLKSSGTITVTPSNTIAGTIPANYTMTVLPPLSNGVLYDGSLTFWTETSNLIVDYFIGNRHEAESINGSGYVTLTFNNIPFLVCRGRSGYPSLCKFTLS